jgi:hypothetical protein
MKTATTGSEVVEAGQPGTPIMLPLRSLLVLGLVLAPFSFFANPPGWVWALMLTPDGVWLGCAPSQPRQGSDFGAARKFSA